MHLSHVDYSQRDGCGNHNNFQCQFQIQFQVSGVHKNVGIFRSEVKLLLMANPFALEL